ncbi:hypothetical protein [Streptomyces peucetius]|nr:hypothetical protein CGZ69_35635 [Streptomyces peucetius subsp. caesius ATCC 27952]
MGGEQSTVQPRVDVGEVLPLADALGQDGASGRVDRGQVEDVARQAGSTERRVISHVHLVQVGGEDDPPGRRVGRLEVSAEQSGHHRPAHAYPRVRPAMEASRVSGPHQLPQARHVVPGHRDGQRP